MTEQTTDQQKVHDLVQDIRFAMLTTTEAGRLVARPMTPLRIDQDLTLYFVTQRDTDVATQADGHPLNVAFAEDGTFVSLTGTGRISDDVELKKDLWTTATDIFTEGGAEDPSNVVLVVDCDSASYWASGSAPATVLGIVKAAITGGRPRSGEHDTVQL